MSSKDAQALFRAAKAQRAGAVKLSKEQIRALKATKTTTDTFAQPPPKAPKLAAGTSPAQRAPPNNGSTAKPGLGGGLLAGYGSSDDDAEPPVAATVIPAPKGAHADLPDDFFQEAPATAGTAQAAPTAAAAEEFDRFMSEVQDDLKQQQEDEEEERQQAEEDDATRAEVEQLLLMSRVEEIKEAAKQRDARSLTLAPELRGQVADMGHAARRRAAVLAQLEGSDDGEDEDEVDWRAKKL